MANRWVGRLVVAAMLLVAAMTSPVMANEAETAELLKVFADEFVSITPGEGKFPASFLMGSKEGDASEQPQHEVTFKYQFAIAKFEVTQNLYMAVMGNNPSKWKGPRNSVEMMSWKDANEFCRKATQLLRDRKLIGAEEVIRLPSEAEWEYCCRAGTSTKYSFGNEAQPDGEESFDIILTGFGDNKIEMIKVVRDATKLGLKEAKDLVESLPKPLRLVLSEKELAALKTQIDAAGGTYKVRPALLLDRYGWHTGNAAGNDPPVGALKPNPWGLYDMHGYLWEFTADEWHPNYSGTPADGTAAKPVEGENKFIVMRSGSWKDKFDKLTSTARRKVSVTAGDDAIGFRCVRAKVR